MKVLLIALAVLMAIAAQAAILSASEQYRELKAAKEREDAAAEKNLQIQSHLIEADRDLAIYEGYLKLRAEHGLDKRLLRFTGKVTQRISVMLGKKELVVRVSGTANVVDVTAKFKDKMPDRIKIGDHVTVSGMFEKGNLTGVTLTKSSVITADMN